MVDLQEFAVDLRNYFKSCPICFAQAKGTFKVHLTLGQRDTLECTVCGSKWHVQISPFKGFEWAELDLQARDGRGKEYLGRKVDKKEILAITEKGNPERDTANYNI
jgi:hypothetical protein